MTQTAPSGPLASGTGAPGRARITAAHPPHRPLVGAAGHHRWCAPQLRHLRHLAGLRERLLLRVALPVAVLLTVRRPTNCVPGSDDFGRLVGDWYPLSPALLILVFPLGFRMTCYYYRKAYYRSFWLSPPACAVAEPHRTYTGETRAPLILQNSHRWFFYAGLAFNVILTWDAVLGFRNSDGEWGHMGLGTVVLLTNATLLWLYSLSCHSCRNTIGGRLKHFSKHPMRYRMWTFVSRLNTSHPLFAWISLFGVALHRLLHPLLATRHDHRPHASSSCHATAKGLRMTDLERHSYDVVVIGAGGAGLRAAIEAREQGKRTAIICKSLFGKAHTVMAEGGIAASMGNVNSKDSWQVHFRDTMRGGKFLNHWRMAELHAKEAPERVWELETWGALFDRTPDGRISQRNFGGHEYPRLAHVGDRTGLELIRTLQQKIVSLQQEDERELGDPEARLRVFAECTITEILKDGDRVAGAFGYWRESGRFVAFDAPAVVLATGGIGKSFKVTQQLVGVHRRRPRPGAAGRRRRWSTWSSSSSTRPAWSGRRASRASSSPSRCAATAAS